MAFPLGDCYKCTGRFNLTDCIKSRLYSNLSTQWFVIYAKIVSQQISQHFLNYLFGGFKPPLGELEIGKQREREEALGRL